MFIKTITPLPNPTVVTAYVAETLCSPVFNVPDIGDGTVEMMCFDDIYVFLILLGTDFFNRQGLIQRCQRTENPVVRLFNEC